MARHLACATALALILALTSCSTPTVRGQALTPRLAKLSDTSRSSIRGEALLEPKAVAAFYQARQNQAAWDLPGDAESIRKGLADLAQDGLDPSDYHLALIDAMLAERKSARSDELDADLELVLSDAVAAAVDELRYGHVRPKSLNPTWNVDPREGAPPLQDAIGRVAAATSPQEGLEREKIDHFIYKGLKQELARLEAVQQAGGWPAVPPGRLVAPGARDPRLPRVRARLRAEGELAADARAAADSLVYDGATVEAVKVFQDRHRLSPTGRIDKPTVDAMDVTAAARIGQVRANLERARWVLPGLGSDFVLVNLPAFKVYLIRGGQRVWETRAVIGKQGRETPSFRANMKYVIFNPTWTVPPTILAEDVIGSKKGAAAAVAEKHLRVLDAQGNEVDPSSVDWSAASGGNFKYTLRQDSGDDNALGRLKFMFPNKYDVYLHDTPHRDLFAKDTRTFSSGCIRLQDPRGLAVQLLGDQGYDAARVDETIDAGETKQVDLTQPLPVLIVYWTVSVGTTGDIHYGPDVYGLDPPLVQALGVVAERSANAGGARAQD